MYERQETVKESKKVIGLYENTCDFCGTCVGVCPENCIELEEAKLSVQHDLCTLCHKCIWICPVEALYLEEDV